MDLLQDFFGAQEVVRVINHNDEFEIDGLTYIPNFITKSEHDFLLRQVDKQTWLTELKRRVQHYGYKYDYKSRKIDHSMRIADLPSWLQEFAIRLKDQAIFKETPDQVIINEYIPGQGITSHIDCEPCFTDTIASISLGSQCVMSFTDKNDKDKTHPYLLDTCSIIILKGNARYNWMHGIKAVKTDSYFGHKIRRERRISLTFRKVIVEE